MNKGHKRKKGVPELYDETKKQVSISLTPTAVKELDVLAKQEGVSRSEFIERIARHRIPIADNQTSTNSQNCEQQKYSTETINNEPLIEFSARRNIIRLSEWENLPDSPGVFSVYIEGNPIAYLKVHTNMKQAFIAELKTKPDIEELISDDGNAYLIWNQCNDEHFFPKLKNIIWDFLEKLEDGTIPKCNVLPKKKAYIDKKQIKLHILYLMMSYFQSSPPTDHLLLPSAENNLKAVFLRRQQERDGNKPRL
ncbi:CopG/DNA-binding domain-containing protein [Nostoc carneum NIES-2107]|nr:CopG/DNA-binding domain-containing protein [Nostoc carneum NIES-2107]